MPPLLKIDGDVFRDRKGREVLLHGINVAADAKLPRYPNTTSHEPRNFLEGDTVSFVDRPFSVHDAPRHFSRLRSWGYNTIRYIFTWEALEHEGPGKYDEAFIEHTISVLRCAKEAGFYVFMDPHQDVWSRFTGGSGAPMWTVYACGLDPTKFAATEAAMVQNTWPDPSKYPKMIWATNYTRLACQVLFTLFFAGRQFAPKAIIDNQNIQDYLQSHFISACRHLALRIREAGDLHGSCIIGWESINEPNRGLIGCQDLTVVPSEQKLQKGTSPTAWQAILTGSGVACDEAVWDVGGMGSYKSGSKLVDPAGQRAWLQTDLDSHYGWKRDPGWKLGECLWAQHGIWDPDTNTLRVKDYFAKDPETGLRIDYEYFTNHFYMHHYRRYRDAVREVFPDTIMFCQPPVLEIPPSLKDTVDDDPNMVFAPHWYDGITLLTKKWNRVWNIDVFGVLRGKYLTPAFAIKIGETAIRNCFRDQLSAIRHEGTQYMGVRPCVFTELGIPFDMDDGYAYKTGDYSSQVRAMDANHFAVEGSKLNFTLWTYVASNDHTWGDQWNGEDLSIFSVDDVLPGDDPSSTSEQLNKRPAMEESQQLDGSNESTELLTADHNGNRAAAAFIRPYPVAVHGHIVSSGFDINTCEYTLALEASEKTSPESPTEVYLPSYRFPPSNIRVEVSDGKWDICKEPGSGKGHVLRWWHAEGRQSINVSGPAATDAQAEGYLEVCRESGCIVM